MNRNNFVVQPETVDTVVTDYATAKIMSDPEMTGLRGMSAVVLFIEPGHGHSRHNHPESEQMIFVITGKGEHTTELAEGQKKVEKVSSGSLICIPKGAYHSTYNTGWEPMQVFAVFTPPGPEAAVRALGDSGGVGTALHRVVPAGEVPLRR
jgi:oxalate decarboxylase/phosphoglucose isomerase-like protein (cupin superfamily)